MTMRITENHSFSKKVNRFYDLMKELGITIENDSMGGLNLIDTENNRTFRLRDLDSGQGEPEFPTLCEFKLTFEDDDF